jgi:hypothetical protein
MEFNEILAWQIIEKHDLPDRFFYMWRLRGCIPAQYAQDSASETFDAPEMASEGEIAFIGKIFAIPAIKSTGFAVNAKFNTKSVTKIDYENFIVELIEYRKILFSVVKITTQSNLHVIYSHDKTCEQNLFSVSIRKQLSLHGSATRQLSLAQIDAAKQNVADFYIKLCF